MFGGLYIPGVQQLSGAISSGVLADGSVLSGTIGSGQIGSPHIADGTVITIDVGSGAIVSGLIASGQIGHFHIASGQLTGTELGSGAIVSGRVASGQLGTFHLASGAVISHAQEVAPFYSGANWTITTAEIISGVRAVALNQSGQLVVAMAAVSGRMPAIGVCDDPLVSGASANVHVTAFKQFSSGLADFSGYVGKRIWVGRSGQLTTVSGAWSSGGFASGDLGQALGTVVNSGAALVNVFALYWSGGPLGLPSVINV